MTTTLSKNNPPQVGDRLVHNGAVCVESRDSDWSVWELSPLERASFGLTWFNGLEVERAEEQIVTYNRTVRRAGNQWHSLDASASNIAHERLSVGETGYYKTTVERISESEYKRLRGEG